MDNPSGPNINPGQGRGEISVPELRKLYKEFSSFGTGGSQVMMINDPEGLMNRFKYGIGEFRRFVMVFNKMAMESNVPIFIKFERKNSRYYLCSNKEGEGFSLF